MSLSFPEWFAVVLRAANFAKRFDNRSGNAHTGMNGPGAHVLTGDEGGRAPPRFMDWLDLQQ
jgi:hypothetical protein